MLRDVSLVEFAGPRLRAPDLEAADEGKLNRWGLRLVIQDPFAKRAMLLDVGRCLRTVCGWPTQKCGAPRFCREAGHINSIRRPRWRFGPSDLRSSHVNTNVSLSACKESTYGAGGTRCCREPESR